MGFSKMIRIMIIECILSGTFGAISFRLAWAFSKNRKVSWGVAIILGVAVLIFVPGGIDAGLISEYGGKPSSTMILPPIAISIFRSLCLLVGAWLASLVVRYREKMGLERDYGFKDFP